MKQLILRMPDDLHKAIKEQAEKNRRSLTQEILKLIEDSIPLKPKGKTLFKNKRKK